MPLAPVQLYAVESPANLQPSLWRIRHLPDEERKPRYDVERIIVQIRPQSLL